MSPELRHWVVALSPEGETIAIIWPFEGCRQGSADHGKAMAYAGERNSQMAWSPVYVNRQRVGGFEVVSEVYRDDDE